MALKFMVDVQHIYLQIRQILRKECERETSALTASNSLMNEQQDHRFATSEDFIQIRGRITKHHIHRISRQ
jgi:hypothetical protein